MSDREPLEVFLLELDHLLGRPEQDEDSFQQLLERHQVVFAILGYSKVLPKPRLSGATQDLIPDFLVCRDNGIWEVFELKRPDTSIVRPTTPRERFYAECESYLSQCTEYSQYFDDAANRAQFRERYGVEVQKGVPAVLIAGRNSHEVELAAHRLLHYRNGQIRLQTYDSLRRAVAGTRTLAFGKRDSRPGFSAHLIVRFWPITGFRNHVFEFLDHACGATLSMLIDENSCLCLELSEGAEPTTVARAPMQDYLTEYGAWHYISIDVATIDDLTLVSMEVDARRFCDRMIDRVQWTLANDSRLSVGAPASTNDECSFDFARLLVLKDTQSLDERLKIRTYFLGLWDNVGQYTEWRGHARMQSQ